MSNKNVPPIKVAVRKADDGDNETNNIETPDYDEHRVKKSAD